MSVCILGNVAYAPDYGKVCRCPCHTHANTNMPYECWCACAKRNVVKLQDNKELSVLRETINKLQERLHVLERIVLRSPS